MFDDGWVGREPPAWLDEPAGVTGFDAVTRPNDAAAALALTQAGAGVVAALAAVDLARLDDAGRVDVLAALERQIGWLQGLQQRVLADIDRQTPCGGRPGQQQDRNLARESVGCALRLAGLTAQARLAVASALRDRLPDTLAMLEAGEITYWHARALAEAVAVLDETAAAVVEARVLPRAGRQSVGEFRASVRRAVLAADPASAEQRHQRALGDRCVRHTPAEDGMASIWALLPAEGAAGLMAAVDALASVTSEDDPRTAEQRRADALVDLGVAALHDPLLPRSQGLRPNVQVTIALSTLLGLDEHPAELGGHGPITAELARRMAADQTGTWRRLVLDPVTGDLIDYGQHTYRPPADLRRFVIARDKTCGFPHCQRPAPHCDLDHRIRHVDGGPTSQQNIAPLCPRHHAVKDEHGWQVQRDPTGGYTWTSPTGHTYHSHTPSHPNPPPPQPAQTEDVDPAPF